MRAGIHHYVFMLRINSARATQLVAEFLELIDFMLSNEFHVEREYEHRHLQGKGRVIKGSY